MTQPGTYGEDELPKELSSTGEPPVPNAAEHPDIRRARAIAASGCIQPRAKASKGFEGGPLRLPCRGPRP